MKILSNIWCRYGKRGLFSVGHGRSWGLDIRYRVSNRSLMNEMLIWIDTVSFEGNNNNCNNAFVVLEKNVRSARWRILYEGLVDRILWIMNIFLKRIICNEIIRLYTMHFLKGIYLWKKKKKKIFIIVIIISLSIHTHKHKHTYFWVANILESSECFLKCKNNTGMYFRTKHEDPLNSTDIRVIFAMRDEYIWTVPSVTTHLSF